ncbi:MAG: hypothetical protein FD123_2938 [Bacteroidetes bacterium]|nr:MAG: hypothetical protein FD123_2938 [Bacteroidota bacterium]
MQDLVFDIIHSMSKNEKGFFRKYSRIHSGKDAKTYLLLFDVLDGMKTYDESELKKKALKFIPERLLPATKNYLKNNLVKTLRLFHEEISPEVEINNKLTSIEIFFRRRLKEHCRREIAATRRLIEAHELYRYLHQLAFWERQLLRNDPQSKESHAGSEILHREERANLDRLKNVVEIEALAERLYHITFSVGNIRNEETLQEIRAIFDHPLMQDENRPLTTCTKITYYNMHSKYGELVNDLPHVYDSLSKSIRLLHEREEFRQANTGKYIHALYNFMMVSIWLNRNDAYFEAYENFRNIPGTLKKSPSPTLLEVHRMLLLNIRIYYFSRNFLFDEIILLHDVQGKNILQKKPAIYAHVHLETCCSFASALFATGNLKGALKWINKVINEARNDLRKDLLASMRLLNLLVHYELGNDVLLLYEIRSTERYLAKIGRKEKSETSLVKFIRLLLEYPGEKKNRQADLNMIYEETASLRNHDFEKNAFQDIDLVPWMKAKVNGTDYTEAYRNMRSLPVAASAG